MPNNLIATARRFFSTREAPKALRSLFIGKELVWWDTFEASFAHIDTVADHADDACVDPDLRPASGVACISFCEEARTFGR